MATKESEIAEERVNVGEKDPEVSANTPRTSALDANTPDRGSDETKGGDQPLPFSEYEDNSNVPKLSLWQCFRLFLVFGCLAWGGPVVQIQMIKEKLVIDQKWITMARFSRVFAVYQILPGPEAAELCMFFGCLTRGPIGGIIAGFGFMIPGFILMLILSYVYAVVSVENPYFGASFRALRPVVAATVFRAVHKISEHALISHKTNKFEKWLFILAALSAVQSALRINLFITLGVFGLIYTALDRKKPLIALAILLLELAGFAVYVVYNGMPSPFAIGIGVARVPDAPHLLGLGLVTGSLSFGGAYTTIPFIQAEAVYIGGWLSRRTFLDGIALGQILPAPLVIFNTFVGFQGAYIYGGLGYAFAGASLMTLGVFFPCFLFTIAGHHLLERLVRNKTLAAFFEGLTGAVIGIIAITALDLLKAAVSSSGAPGDNAIAAVLFMLTLAAIYTFKHPQLSIILVAFGAIAGQFLFAPEA